MKLVKIHGASENGKTGDSPFRKQRFDQLDIGAHEVLQMWKRTL
jgi:hypothetical protein